MLLFFFLFFVLFSALALAFALEEWTGKSYWSFLIVGGIFLGAGIGILAGKERMLQIPIMNAIIQELFNNHHEKDQTSKAVEE